MDRLMTMRTFVEVAQHSSFSEAADALGISRTVVSRHVADLEGHLGARLLHRTTRAVTLTATGYSYLATCKRVLAEIETGEEQIAASRNEVTGEISILCPIWIGSFGVSDAVAEFCVRNPSVTIRLIFEEPSANPHDFLDRGFDLCVQPTTLRDSSIKIKKIAEIEFQMFASPAYLERSGTPQTPADLADHHCLTKAGDRDWPFIDGSKVPLERHSAIATNSVFALMTAAATGLGIAIVPGTITQPLVKQGQLVQVLADHPLRSRPFYVAFAPGGDIPNRVRTFLAFLSDWFAGQG